MIRFRFSLPASSGSKLACHQLQQAGTEMKIEQVVLEKSAETLLERAGDCFDIADTQHKMAEQQHQVAARQSENADRQQAIAAGQHMDADKLSAKADKLDALGRALEAEAIKIAGEMQVVQCGDDRRSV